MTKLDRAALERHLLLVADLMGLRDWTFKLLDERPDDLKVGDAYATCEPIYGQKFAKVSFCDDFRDLPADEQRWIVTHELLHCHLAGIQECFETRALQEQLGRPLMTMFESRCTLALEQAVDAIAREWMHSLPRIAWPRPKKRGAR